MKNVKKRKKRIIYISFFFFSSYFEKKSLQQLYESKARINRDAMFLKSLGTNDGASVCRFDFSLTIREKKN